MDLISETLAASTSVPTTNGSNGASATLFGTYLRPDAKRVGSDWATQAVTGRAPDFDAGTARFLNAGSRTGERRDVEGVDLGKAKFVRSEGQILLSTARGDFAVREHPFAQLCTSIGAPAKYLAALPPPIALDALNWGLEHHGKDRRTLRLEGNEVRAIVSRRYSPLDDHEAVKLVRVALEKAGRLDEAQIEAFSAGKTSTLRVSFGEVRAKGAKDAGYAHHAAGYGHGEGFGLRAGITIRNGELGNGSLKVGTGMWRHWCSNGAMIDCIKGSVWNRWHVGNWEDQAMELAAALEDIIANADRVMQVAIPGALADVFSVQELRQRLRKLDMTNPERNTALRETIAEHFGLYRFDPTNPTATNIEAQLRADEVMEAIRKARKDDEAVSILEELKVSRWDMFNGVTAVARDASAERQGDLESVGGSLLAEMLS